MKTDGVLYLREDTYFEPLFNHWYASCFLLSPATAAKYTANTHKRVMASFVNNPRLHVIGARDPALAGAEFLNCSEDQLEDVRALLEELERRCASLLDLAEGLGQLDELLRGHTSGESVERLYAQIPKALRGYVEVVLDLEHRATYRLLEPLLYRSRFYMPELQSCLFGLLSRVSERPFVLSTPRLPDRNHLCVEADFNSRLLDETFQARTVPVSSEKIEALWRGHESRGGIAYRDLFTATAPKRLHQPVSRGIRMRYTGHAGFVIETAQVTILVDPVIPSRDFTSASEVISFSELPPRIDYICLTHAHQDHANLETLLQLRHKTRCVLVPKNNGGSLADPSLRLALRKVGFVVIELDELDQVDIPMGRIVSVPFLGEHGDLNIRSKTAWLVEVEGKKLFFGADSANLDNALYCHLRDWIGGVDVLCIGMECVGAPYTWLYGALHTRMVPKAVRESRRLNGCDFAQALQIVDTFGPQEVFVYALGLEPWYKYFMGIQYEKDSKQILESNKLIAACQAKGIRAEALYGSRTLTY